MKKVKLFFVTYNAKDDLDKTIRTCIDASHNPGRISLEIHIINNHTNFYLADDLSQLVHVYHNTLRPDFSTGHLSRNWNQAIINGFKSLTEPECDILITCQDDAIWKDGWVDTLLSIHEQYDFYTSNNGDMLCSYTPEAVRKIGMWDERFCNIQFQEADYFLRANLYHGDKSTINDVHHGRTLNPTTCITERPNSGMMRAVSENTNLYHEHSKQIFTQKWGGLFQWNGKVTDVQHSMIPSFVYYPYFEKDIENLKEKGYVVI